MSAPAAAAPAHPELDPPVWSFDVTTVLHDDLKPGGRPRPIVSRVSVSRDAFPAWPTAAEVAACIAVGRHGGMPVSVAPRY